MTDRTTRRHAIAALGALVLAAGVSVASAPEARAQHGFDPNGRFCFSDGSGKTNVFQGSVRGFTAYPAGRPGNSLYYRRVDSRTYVSDTGGIYTFNRAGDRARWQGGGTVIRLFRC